MTQFYWYIFFRFVEAPKSRIIKNLQLLFFNGSVHQQSRIYVLCICLQMVEWESNFGGYKKKVDEKLHNEESNHWWSYSAFIYIYWLYFLMNYYTPWICQDDALKPKPTKTVQWKAFSGQNWRSREMWFTQLYSKDKLRMRKYKIRGFPIFDTLKPTATQY